VLWGWSPTTTQTHVYERVWWNPATWFSPVRTIETTESEFDAGQLALVTAVQGHLDMLGGHGQPLDESMSPAADPNSGEGTHYYVAGTEIVNPQGERKRVPLVDFAEKARLDAQDAYREAAGEGANLNGLIWPVSRIDRT
jgi:hypothetical protein